jgi:hypothetical protein
VWTDLVQTEEAKVTDDSGGTDTFCLNYFSSHLQADLHDLYGVGKDHLTAASLSEHTLIVT